MTTHSPRLPNTTEANARMEFWLKEFGRFPTRDALRRIRQHRASTDNLSGRLVGGSSLGSGASRSAS